MKRKLITLFLLVAIATSVSAQTSFDKITIGIKGGLNISKINSNSPSVEQKPMSSLLEGIFVSIPLNKNFSFQPELNYARVGGKYNLKVTNLSNLDWGAAYARFGDELFEIDLNYIDLPLIFKYKVSKSHLSLLAGPQVSYLLAAKAIVSKENHDIKNELNQYDFRGVFGAEYNLPKGFVISARYQLGLYIIPNNADANEEFKNNALSFTLGYTLGSK